jgi:hypothetical protein
VRLPRATHPYIPMRRGFVYLTAVLDRATRRVLALSRDPSFRSSYSTKMRGGFLRFQAQYLRRIRILDWRCVPEQLRVELVDAATKRDRQACDCAVFKLYSLSSKEKSVFEGGVE